MATIRDVAKLANVSVATVSRVINKNGYVNESTMQRVRQAIEQLNYRPNDVARSLFKGKSKMIALFVPDIMNPFFPELARAVEDISNKHGYTFILCNTDNQNDKEIAYLNALLQKSIDGIILVSSTMTTNQVKDMKVPVIALDRKINPDLISVTVNNYEGARQAVQYLKNQGCKRIAHVSGPENISNARERFKGYLDEVRDEEWFHSDFICVGNYAVNEAFEATKNLLKRNPEIDGIFVANDLMGVGVLKAAESLKIKIPNELSVIGFDGIELGNITSPSLTTMAQPIYSIGKRAAEILIQKIEHPNTVIKSEEHKVKLTTREST
ncbi:LacI family DNA-binding transcriptional regulator [Oceanobacillus profundus]|uniref:Catabolite control protein A n=1 Tax=Oceanobacillus profundus TaxID=372463 RepID=A0A417YN71_9BACI|nr:LacI family DNA-binding transcriptional regulator [Oceanobacillus profundus]MBR3118640.1 LacI family DNA-binding transcriptional regulator [Oceanobacillus sp.]PAE29195.1 transcriptional regulator [Paenibacillus sp. 7884-2]MCM3398238.1 LacI family transcriptional regulator [Oceanobacillus profundus]MDO6447858.1 LacI family DNA-binding transcriptional regulator [Oceanobacillus profundus]RHW35070.1 LacI family transcriptional regulator [Oceanobacillus profundus]